MGGRCRELHHAQCHVHGTSGMASNVCTVLETQASNELYHHSKNILVVKGTVHTRDLCKIATVIALARFYVGCLKKSLKVTG